MIYRANTVSNNRTKTYLATKRVLIPTQELRIVDSASCQSFALCFDCSIPMFANPTNPTDNASNDKYTFIYNILSTESIVAKIIDSDGNSTTVTNNNYGFLYAVGTQKANVWVWEMDALKIANTLGFDKYTIEIEITNIATENVVFSESVCFKIMPFTCESAHGTVRISAWQSGYIENGFDYTGMLFGGILQQIRVYGSFKLKDHTVETDNVQLSNKTLQQVQTKIVDNFELNLLFLRSKSAKKIIKDFMIGNDIIIDTYGVDDIEVFRNKYVNLVDINEPIPAKGNGTYIYSINLVENRQNTIKRNYK
jgi:hypothetical protein